MKPDPLPSKHIVLLGVGHTNAHIVRMWGMHRFNDVSLTCVSDNAVASYSGMLPAVLAGQKTKTDMEIDLVRLCNSVGARLITGEVTGLDRERRELQIAGRPAVYFDALSIGVGSVPMVDGIAIEGDSMLKIKPMQSFLDRLTAKLQACQVALNGRPLKVVVVGSGVAGTEILFCLPAFLKNHDIHNYSLTMVTRSEQILPSVSAAMRGRAMRECSRRQIDIRTRSAVVAVRQSEVELSGNQTLPADILIWATGASAPPLLDRLGLPVNELGFLATEPTLQSTCGAPVFAVGDTGTIRGSSLAKAGVYAVRQGPILWQNLRRILCGQTLVEYKPQTSFMKLINKGDGSAIGEWKGVAFEGRWAMRLKDRIDTKFMEKYAPQIMESDGKMQCKGCGCKLGADVLDGAIDFADRTNGPENAVELEDAAPIGDDDDNLIASTDFFTSPVDDAYLSGRIAALHSASDIIASGARVTQAIANVVLPEGDTAAQGRMLRDFTAGAGEEFAAMGARVVGGHTIVGPRFEAGFTVIGKPLGASPLCKGNLKTGDLLVLTKPLGVGILFAAHMRSLCKAADYQRMLTTVLLRQNHVAEMAVSAEVTAGTDVTGFGLMGHLLEMLDASKANARLDLESIPILPGVESAIRKGIESSLAPQNLIASARVTSDRKADPRYKALFDPQTCGGLLLGMSAERFEKLKSEIGNGYETWKFGTVEECVRSEPQVFVD